MSHGEVTAGHHHCCQPVLPRNSGSRRFQKVIPSNPGYHSSCHDSVVPHHRFPGLIVTHWDIQTITKCNNGIARDLLPLQLRFDFRHCRLQLVNLRSDFLHPFQRGSSLASECFGHPFVDFACCDLVKPFRFFGDCLSQLEPLLVDVVFESEQLLHLITCATCQQPLGSFSSSLRTSGTLEIKPESIVGILKQPRALSTAHNLLFDLVLQSAFAAPVVYVPRSEIERRLS